MIECGAKFRREILVSGAMVKAFADLTGDSNPVHLDVKAAQKRGFKGKVVQGMFLIALIGSLFPEALLRERLPIFRKLKELTFSSPVYVGQMVEITGEIGEIRELKGLQRAEVKVTVFNQDENKTALRGTLIILI